MIQMSISEDERPCPYDHYNKHGQVCLLQRCVLYVGGEVYCKFMKH